MMISCRAMQETDKEFFFTVYASSRAEEMALVPWTSEQKQSFLRMQSGAQLKDYQLHYPHAEYQIIEQAGCRIGRMILDRSDNPILLIDICLLSEFRNAGIGTTLLNDLISEAEKTKRAIRLHVEAFNPARRLYDRLGFKESKDLGIYHEMTRAPIGILSPSGPHQP